MTEASELMAASVARVQTVSHEDDGSGAPPVMELTTGEAEELTTERSSSRCPSPFRGPSHDRDGSGQRPQ